MKRMIQGSALFVVFILFAGNANALLLETIYARNNGGGNGGAVYFDILTGAQDINITQLFTNTEEVTGPTAGFQVYTKLGTAQGSEANGGAWNLASTATITGLGSDQKSPVVLDSLIMLAANTLYGFALVMPATLGHDYTGTGTSACAVPYTNSGICGYSDANLSIFNGAATNIPFTGGVFVPRVWNGGIEYSIADGSLPVPTTLGLLGLGVAGLGWSKRRKA